ncbi:MAG: TPM domain-containing protein [Bacteroidota bacterium]
MKKLALVFLFALCGIYAFAQKLPNTPTTYITDLTNTVEASYSDSITNLLADLERDFGVQFLVYVDSSLNGKNLEDYTEKLFNHWKLGQKGKDNGILLAIFLNERKFRIEIGYGLEDKIPDLLATRIQEQYLVPEFRKGDFGKGIYDCAKGLYDAATDYKFDLNGEKRKQYLNNLIITDKAGVLTEYDKNDLLYPDNRDYSQYLNDYGGFVSFYYFGYANTSAELKQQMAKQWREIQANFPNEKNKLFVGFSASAPVYAIYLDESIQPYLKEDLSGKLYNFVYGKHFLNNFENREFKQLSNSFGSAVQDIIEVNSFKSSNPVYTFFFSGFYKKNEIYFCYDYYQNIIYTSIALAVFIPWFLIIVLILLSKQVSLKVKTTIIAWSFLNYILLILIVGYLFNIALLITVIKIFRKRGNWQTKVNEIEKTGVFGNFSGKGGGSTYSSGGSSYRSSGSSWSSSSSSSSRSSSSSSSSRSFSGGGGGRSGGGGSSGSW